jgi:CheY-like chemotaxis protein
VVNARDAMPSGGAVTITTTNTHLRTNECNALPAGPYVVLEVRDTGTGMTKEVLARALEPFFTTKEAGRGTGLGLSTTYGFVRQSGGDLAIESEVGVGTTVKIYLPRHEIGESAEEPEYDTERQAPRAQGSEIILAVEDDPQVRNITSSLLRDLGYRVLEAADATKALEILEKNEVSLLFTDLVMPGDVNGYQLATEALRRRPDMRVLYTSAHAGDRILEIAGCALQPMLRKPYRDDELARAIRDALTTP